MQTSQVWRELHKTHTVASIIDELAARCPDQPYASIPVDETDPASGWRDVDVSTFSRMINKAAWWLTEALGPGNKEYKPIHFFIPCDISSLVFIIASWKAGYKGLFFHPLATPAIHTTINELMSCDVIVFSGELPPEAKALSSSAANMKIIAAPPLRHWFEGPKAPPCAYPRTLSEARDTPMAVVHSSGTTGPPKAITFTQGSFMSMVSSMLYCDNVDRLSYAAFRGQRVATLVPTTIGAGFFHNLGANFCFDYTIALRRLSEPLSAKTLDTMMLQAGVTALVTAPPVLVNLIDEPVILERFKDRIHATIYAGAPLPHHVGDILAHHTLLSGTYGSTETGVYPIYLNPPEDWTYYEYDPVFTGALQPVGRLGYHEVVIPLSDNPEAPFQAVFTLFPESKEWRTKDVFLRHENPDKKNLWRYVGRTDDFIVDSADKAASNGTTTEPFLPNDMESVMNKSEHVSGFTICENRAGKIAAVVEPKLAMNAQNACWGAESRAEFIQSISETLNAANKICPIAGQIPSELLLIATEPLPRGTKGYPQRERIQDTYAAAINEAYTRLE